MARLFVLDAMGLAYRAHYAFIRRPLVNSKGEHTSAIFGLANTALKIRREEQPDYWALAWDGPGPTHRHERYEPYKATRKPTPEELLAQIPAIEDLAHALSLPVLEVPGMEADDVMATLAVRGAAAGLDVALVTSDKDMLQLVGDHVKLFSPAGRDEYTWVDADAVRDKWGVAPEQIRDVLALMGDSSDNVPGVPGVGQKTAVDLISQFGTLDELYRRLAEVKRAKLREKLEQHREQAYLSRDLVTVETDCDLPYEWEALRCGPIRREAMRALAKRWEIVRLERIADQMGVDEAEAGAAPPRRDHARRGTTSEMRGTGVRLAIPEPPAPDPGDRPEDQPPPAPWTEETDFEPPADGPPREGSPPETPASERTAREPRDASPEAPAKEIPPREPRVVSPPIGDRPVVHEDGGLAGEEPEPVVTATAPAAEPSVPAGRRLSKSAVAAKQVSLDLWGGDGGGFAAGAGLAAWTDRIHAVRARAIHGLAVAPVAVGEDPRTASVLGLALAARDGTTCYVPLAHEGGPNVPLQQARDWLTLMLEDPNVPKVSEDLKRDTHLLASIGLPLGGYAFDLHLASFLCDPERDHGLDALARDLLGSALEPVPSAGASRKARETLRSSPPETVAAVAERAVAAIYPVADALRAQLEAREQWALYARLEHPLIAVLLEMERTGVMLDSSALADMSARAGHEMAGLEQKLHDLAGESFNLNSGPQLARILFEKLGLTPGRRTKTGFSTDQAVLEELANEHELPARLLEYRALAKLKSTYLDALPAVVDPRDGRVHTTFNQAGAATGRLSSSNPNLQNIPMRTPQGRAVRRAFVAPAGRILVGADYSQIELRIMAHLSGDPGLIEAFKNGEDIHESTARRIFGVTSGDLDPALRSRAKVVNFGIMYGMGARSLSQQMGIDLKEAQAFIKSYFDVFARVRDFLDATLADARRRGYVETLFGRRRYLPDIASDHGARRAAAERVAVNTPIQGAAADLMKLAMIRVHAALKVTHPSARLLLQVHDELLLECARDEADSVEQSVRSEMVGCVQLDVPLEVSVGRGASWYEVH